MVYTNDFMCFILSHMGDEKKKSHFGASAVFWLVFALILLIAFLVNRNKIIGVLQRTGFFTKVFGTEPAFVLNHQEADDEPVAELSSTETVEVYGMQEPEIVLVPQNNRYVSVEEPAVPDTAPEESVKPEPVEEKKEIKVVPSVQVSQVTESETVQKMAQHLCFVVISGDGSVLRKEIERSIPKTITPLTAAMNALLEGPSYDELEKGYMSLIPEGTQLLGASVKDGVANINLSSAFRFNKYGVEGYYGQLAQIVYTATTFSNINSVQFLIEGEKIDYLSEGVFIGAPLSRTSLY